MHSPLIVSGLIMFAVLFTMLGSVHIDEGKISVEPTARNLIFLKQPITNQSFDIRGPYTVDSALENEYSAIRLPQDAINTLELGYGDHIIINGQNFVLNQSIPGEEESIMRIPFNARTALGINVRDTIRDTELRNFFKDIYAEKNIPLESAANLTVTEGLIIKNTASDGKIINLYLNNQKIATTTGILKDGTYKLYLNGYLYKTIQIDKNDPQKNFTVTKGYNVIKIEVAGDTKSNSEFPTSDQGVLFYFNFPSS